MRTMRLTLSLLFLLFFGESAQAQRWQVQTSGIDTNLRGVSVVYKLNVKYARTAVVWVSGSKGVILKSLDEGKTWQRLHVEGGEALDFRGIVAFSEKTAYLMSSGEGEKSRIYKTADGGETWKLQHTDNRKEFFLDTIACASETRCFALGDPIDGKFLLLTTTDGEHWNLLPGDERPAALPGEGSFAASNSCLALFNNGQIYFVTGGPAARFFHSPDGGHTWTVAETPIGHGNASSGIFSIASRDGKAVTIVGGDYQDPKRASAVAAYSFDGGKTWQLSTQQPGGFRSAVASLDERTFVIVGPNGEEFSDDGGAHWKQTDALNLNALTMLDRQHSWAVGPKGTIARFVDHAIHRRDAPSH